MNRKKTIILLMVIMVFLSLACWFPPYIQEMSEAPSGDQGSEQIIEETLVFSSKGVSIRLPNSYQLGDIEAGMQALSGLGEYQQLYDKERENIMLWAYESSPSRGQIKPTYSSYKTMTMQPYLWVSFQHLQTSY